MLAKQSPDPAEVLRFGDFELCLEGYELRYCHRQIAIEPQVLEVLAHLARNAGRVVSKDELWQIVWQGRVVSDAAISKQIREARRALTVARDAAEQIKTVYGRGAIFVGEVSSHPTPASSQTEAISLASILPISSKTNLDPAAQSTHDAKLNAFDLRLRAGEMLRADTLQSCARALELYQQAVCLDCRSAQAQAGVAISAGHLSLRHTGEQCYLQVAVQAARQASRINSRLPGTLHACGLVLWLEGRRDEAIRCLEQALVRDPTLEDCLIDFTLMCCVLQCPERAAKISASEPWSRRTSYRLLLFAAMNHMYSGDHRRARDLHERGLCAARQHLERCPGDTRAWSLGSIGLAHLGHADPAIEWSATAGRLAPRDGLVRYNTACTKAICGDLEGALADLRSVQQLKGAPKRSWVQIDRDLSALSNDRRFLQILSVWPGNEGKLQ